MLMDRGAGLCIAGHVLLAIPCGVPRAAFHDPGLCIRRRLFLAEVGYKVPRAYDPE